MSAAADLVFWLQFLQLVPLLVVDIGQQHALDAADLLPPVDIRDGFGWRTADQPIVLVFQHQRGALLCVDVEQHDTGRLRLDRLFALLR